MVTQTKNGAPECPIRHIAFIMDGNGRWAKKRGMPREYGHRKGAEVFKMVVDRCGQLGIEAATFYVFSTENWKRPEKEVSALMKLLDEYLNAQQKQRDIDSKAAGKYEKVLPIEKVAKVYLAEERFRRQQIHRLHRGGSQKNQR